MKLSTLSLSSMLIPLVTAELDLLSLHISVPVDRMRTAMLQGKRDSDGIVEDITNSKSDEQKGYCPSVGSRTPSREKCEEPLYAYFNLITFSEATTIPRPLTVTLFDEDVPRLCHVNVTVPNGSVNWFVDWGLGGEGKLEGIEIVCNMDGD